MPPEKVAAQVLSVVNAYFKVCWVWASTIESASLRAVRAMPVLRALLNASTAAAKYCGGHHSPP